MSLFDTLAEAAKGLLGRAVQNNLPSQFGEVLQNTPLSGLQDQLPDILGQLQSGGLAEHVKSWIDQGANMNVSPDQLFSVLGEDRVREIATSLGLPEDKAMEMLSQYLPGAVNEGAREAEQAEQ